MPIVYGFLLARCGETGLAEDLTAQTWLAAVEAVQRQTVGQMSPAWLVTMARRRLIDHWRRQSVEQRHLRSVERDRDELVDP